MTRLTARVAASAALALISMAMAAGPAHADAQVSVRNDKGTNAIDPTYMTRLDVSGSGFQSIKNGHGGIYVLFGTVNGDWRPSRGGKSGQNYITVPDSQTKNNSGYAKFVAFPGADTADSANGGSISESGTWSTSINVPGASFTAQNGRQVDCRKVSCGVITIGAHGVVNENNESFTKVDVAELFSGQSNDQGDETNSSNSTPSDNRSQAATTAAQPPTTNDQRKPSAPAALTIDRAAARPGRIVAFTGVGLTPGTAVSATFANGLAAAGPLTVSASGELAGLIQLPTDVEPGTYQLRLVGHGDMPSTRFAVVAEPPATGGLSDWVPYVFAGAGLLALLGAITFALVRWKRLSHAS